ncbi:MAG: gfo/Idh/MocA family oxidoreductase [Spirochaetaceae bacterium]|nr:MAG: gfo/Idh/MocA family oxidoreductase [Spirochaetaceae bacterium]
MSDGMNYAPRAKAEAVVSKGEFRVGAIGLDHGHIYGMCHGLQDAGAQIAMVWDPDPDKRAAFASAFPDATVATSEQALLDDPTIQMVASAAVTADRGPIGVRVLSHGKHYFSDKAPFTTFEQLAAARAKVDETGLIWAVCYSERVQNESAVFAGHLIEDGAIGTVLQVLGTGPHRLGASNRPAWFFERERYGGILTDIGSHQIEQFLYFAGATDARVLHSKVANFNNPEYPELEDFGDATLVADNGATGYFRVDWFTPSGLSTWGDGRTFILGTDGYIELRKYVDLARDRQGDQVYLANKDGERHMSVSGTVGFPYFGALILDCLNGTETAMPQAHTFKAAELSLAAQRDAIRIDVSPVKRG